MEPISTTVGAGLVAYASKDLIARLLGPSAEYIGGEIRDLVEKANINLRDIFTKAGRKAVDKLDDESQVNPRVLKFIVNDGSYCDDDTLKEYYAGILASSRTHDLSDDIGVSLLGVLKGLSVYQVRAHYLFYRQFHATYSARPVRLGEQSVRSIRKLYIPLNALFQAIKLSDASQFEAVLVHTITGLIRNDLLGGFWQWGNVDTLKKYFSDAPGPGILLESSLAGMELFIWANGKQRVSPTAFLTSAPVDTEIDFPIVGGCIGTYKDT